MWHHYVGHLISQYSSKTRIVFSFCFENILNLFKTQTWKIIRTSWKLGSKIFKNLHFQNASSKITLKVFIFLILLLYKWMSSLRSCPVSAIIVILHLSAVAGSNAMFSSNDEKSCIVGQGQPSLKIHTNLAFTNSLKGLH